MMRRQPIELCGPLNADITPALCRYIERQTEQELGDLCAAIEHVTICLGAGPRPTPRFHTRCQIELRLTGIGKLVVGGTGPTARAAFDHAADGLAGAVRRELGRPPAFRRTIRIYQTERRAQRRAGARRIRTKL